MGAAGRAAAARRSSAAAPPSRRAKSPTPAWCVASTAHATFVAALRRCQPSAACFRASQHSRRLHELAVPVMGQCATSCRPAHGSNTRRRAARRSSALVACTCHTWERRRRCIGDASVMHRQQLGAYEGRAGSRSGDPKQWRAHITRPRSRLAAALAPPTKRRHAYQVCPRLFSAATPAEFGIQAPAPRPSRSCG